MDLNKLNLFHVDNINQSEVKGNKQDIAIIGISAQVGMAHTKEEFWDGICHGMDFVRDFPEERIEDAKQIYESVLGKPMKESPFQAAYLDRIDTFDATFYNIAPTEAEYMDPNQRLFLEGAWSAILDAGYTPRDLKGSYTGVYLGYTSEDNHYIGKNREIDEFTYGVAVSGSVNSIIASRISYLLDLKGPAMVIDTACSSSLVALNIACKQIQSGESSMALVGGIRLVVAPLQDSSKTIGIESSSYRTKTFDDSADGTGGGEGVICIMIKRLDDAIEDHDNIYALIKGSAINQDGASVGITAPNADSQAEVIKAAWEQAKIDPETISYMEAHGTATKLGDPVEIAGIEQAFLEYTVKKQFCAIGSVKSNVGHLDCAAGLAGLVKASLMLKHKILPPSIHFATPNRNIDFISSPVYINDMMRHWESDGIRRCGVSSFGISGTNCHVVLEEAPKYPEDKMSIQGKMELITISAKTKTALEKMMKQYQKFLLTYENINFHDFCYTINVGREDYNYRVAIIVRNKEEFLTTIAENSLENRLHFYYGNHRVVEEKKDLNTGYYITVQAKEALTEQIDEQLNQLELYTEEQLQLIAQLYIQGGDISWIQIYGNLPYKMSIPSYPFDNKRCWLPAMKPDIRQPKKQLHPYLDEYIKDSYHLKVYEKQISVENCWELRDHKINDTNVLPGTAFIEIAQYVGKVYYPNEPFEIKNLFYLSPLTGAEERLLHVIVNETHTCLEVACHSKSSGDWESHVEFEIHKGNQEKFNRTQLSIDEVRSRCSLEDANHESKQSMVKIEGEGWNNVQEIYSGENEILISLELDQKLKNVKKDYLLFPAMLDPAINGGTYLLEEEYLPFSFSNARFSSTIPDTFYSYITINSKESELFISFDIYLCTKEGEVFAKIDDYRIKKIENPENFLSSKAFNPAMYHEIKWMKVPVDEDAKNWRRIDNILVVGNSRDISFEWLEGLRTICTGEVKVMEAIDEENHPGRAFFDSFQSIIYVASNEKFVVDSFDEVKRKAQDELSHAYGFIRTLINLGVRNDIDIVFITKDGVKVTNEQPHIHPIMKALIGFSISVNLEHKNLKTRAIDVEKGTHLNALLNELKSDSGISTVALRNNCRYIESLEPCIKSRNETMVELSAQGVYVITGGLGGMGLAFTNYLCQVNKGIKVVLLNRSYSMSDFYLSKEDTTVSVKQYGQVQHLLSEGYQIAIEKVDISNYNDLEKVIQKLHQQYGRINGVIHAAGVKGEGFIINRNWSEFEQVLQPKIYGTLALDLLTRQDKPDFFLLCSSITGMFGEPGQSQYTAANAFLDSYCDYRGEEFGSTITINWTGWNESGMAVSNGVKEDNVYVKFISDDAGAQAMMTGLNLQKSRIIVGEFREEIIAEDYDRYNNRIKLNFEKRENIKGMNKINTNTFQSLTISGKSQNDITEIEKNVICAWTNTLGVTEVDINDKFFESGGNSLLASYLYKEISKYYPGILVITDVFMYLTIEEISNFIDSKLNGKEKEFETIEGDNEDVDDLIQKFLDGEISREGLESLL